MYANNHERPSSGLYRQGGYVPGNERAFVSDEIAQVLFGANFLSELHFLELERLIELLQMHHGDKHMRHALPLSQLTASLINLPPCTKIESSLPVLIPIVHLACQTGKCALVEHLIKGRPWFDNVAFEVFRFHDADIVCYVEKPPTNCLQDSLGKPQCGVSHRFMEVSTLTVWISAFEQARSLAGILEQAMLFAQPELYLNVRIFGRNNQQPARSHGDFKLLAAFGGIS